jgi:serine protease AprX
VREDTLVAEAEGARRRKRPGITAHLAAVLAIVLGTTAAGAPPASAHDHSPLLPVIVRSLAGDPGVAQRSVLSVGGELGQRLAIIGGFAARVPAQVLSRLEVMPGIASVTRDVALRPLHAIDDYDAESATGSLYNTARQIGTKWYWNRGFTGSGVDVAVIDTGLSPVPGLTTKNKVYYGPDLSFESQLPHLRDLDTYGHGTHMAGIIAGRDPGTYELNGNHDDFIGVAPGARIVSLKVANAMGATDVSQVIAAIDWAVTNRQRNGLNIRILNLSFGTDGVQHYTLDPLSFAVEQAWHQGIVVIVAAGNAGFGPATLNNPAYNPWVIAVGASDTRGSISVNDDVVASFSSTGDKQRNPDLVAPGKSIVSLRVKGSQLDLSHPEGRVNDRFFKGSGTSQAAAVVSGAAALIIEQRPKITPDQLKHLLTSTAVTLPNADSVAQGKGMIQLGNVFGTPTDTKTSQAWARSTGSGSLDAARGSLRVTDPNGVELHGEIDIFGRPFGSETCAPSEATEPEPEPATEPEPVADDSSDDCAEWLGDSWSSESWTGNSWSGLAWTAWFEQCDTNVWLGNSWSGNSWSGNSWSGNSWSSNTWSSHGWLGVSWGRKRN